MKIHCDECGKYLGDYLYGNGGVEEKANVSGGSTISMLDVVCNECMKLKPEVKFLAELLK